MGPIADESERLKTSGWRTKYAPHNILFRYDFNSLCVAWLSIYKLFIGRINKKEDRENECIILCYASFVWFDGWMCLLCVALPCNIETLSQKKNNTQQIYKDKLFAFLSVGLLFEHGSIYLRSRLRLKCLAYHELTNGLLCDEKTLQYQTNWQRLFEYCNRAGCCCCNQPNLRYVYSTFIATHLKKKLHWNLERIWLGASAWSFKRTSYLLWL